jgi:hypothetical protein
MSNKEDSEYSNRRIVFSGKQKDWMVWEERFLSKAHRRGYKSILLGRAGSEIPKNSVVLVPGTDDNKIKILANNEKGYADLIESFATENDYGLVAFGLCKKTKTKEYRG